MDVERGSRQRREGEADGPWGQRPTRINHELGGVRQTGASGRRSDWMCGDDKPRRAKGLWPGSAWLAEDALRRLLRKEPPTPGRMRESTGELNGCQTSADGRALGRGPCFQPCWGKPTARNDWRGGGKREGLRALRAPSSYSTSSNRVDEGNEGAGDWTCVAFGSVQALLLRSEPLTGRFAQPTPGESADARPLRSFRLRVVIRIECDSH